MSVHEQAVAWDAADSERGSRIAAILRAQPDPILSKAIQAFRRELPALLGKHRGQWVAYCGEERIGLGSTQAELYERCQQSGLPWEYVLVCGIEEAVFDSNEEFIVSSDV